MQMSKRPALGASDERYYLLTLQESEKNENQVSSYVSVVRVQVENIREFFFSSFCEIICFLFLPNMEGTGMSISFLFYLMIRLTYIN